MAGGMKRLAGETAIYGLSSIIGKFLNWMLVPMYTRVLETESDFGIVTNLYACTYRESLKLSLAALFLPLSNRNLRYLLYHY